jgi:phage/plasmid-like protein (TIGR03299 family)
MAHQFESGAFMRGRPAWHGLGVVVQGVQTPREAFRTANADWAAFSKPLFNENLEEQPGIRQICRSDNGGHLSYQSDSYTIIQNSELITLAESVAHSADIESVVVLDGGRKVAFTSLIKGSECEPIKGVPVRQYLVGATSHDGKLPFSVLFSPVNVVCANTLAAAMGEAASADFAHSMRIRHTKNSGQLVAALPTLMDIKRRQFAGGLAELQAMAATQCNYQAFRGYVAALFADSLAGIVNDTRGDATTARPKQLEDLAQWADLSRLFDGGFIGADNGAIRGTYWAAYQAVTEYLTHTAGRAKDPTVAARKRLESLYWGDSADVLNRAHSLALAATKA